MYSTSSYIRTHDVVGIVVDYDENSKVATIEQRNKIFKGDMVEILTPKGDNFTLTLEHMWNVDGEEIDSTPHPQMIYKIKTDKKLKPYDMLVKEKGDKDE
ncbi:U32 family peptidase C-terminal domain-containing protein [Caloramator sp. Dgby_cultured_2]|uniref:U32 family peptidase C-terminal domain-containing protein n=1 Tax=Caloramator sp. Dgby_cultured_2 TaxID=3029174 RepID=UPI00406C1D57